MTRRSGGAGEHGSATMWLVPMIAVLGAVTLVLGHVGAALVVRRQAESAADLAALAGAAAVQLGHAGCTRAAEVAERNGAELVGCAVAHGRVTVRVRRGVQLPILDEVPVTRRARAGPTQPFGANSVPRLDE